MKAKHWIALVTLPVVIAIGVPGLAYLFGAFVLVLAGEFDHGGWQILGYGLASLVVIALEVWLLAALFAPAGAAKDHQKLP